jgi:hypothetical protein
MVVVMAATQVMLVVAPVGTLETVVLAVVMN